MESDPVSWQFENFSSAELKIPYSPISPSPPSPSASLYNGVSSAEGKAFTNTASVTPQPFNSFISIRAQLASNILNDLEQQELKIESNDFGMNWNEESVNLNLFEELSEIEYTPPASPKRSISTLAETSHRLPANSNSSFFIQLTEPMHHLNGHASESSADITTLTAEFQAILDSLPKDSDNTDALSHVLEIAGIPTTIIDGEALVPVELDLSSITYPGQFEFGMEEEGMDLDDMDLQGVDDNDSDVIDESELYEISNQGSPASSIYTNPDYETAAHFVVDKHSEAAQNILDALLVGDVVTAEAYLPGIANDDESSMSSEDSVQLLSSHEQNATSSSSAVKEQKPERRGRKPGKKLAKGSPAYVKDKTLRKKEQNKTAATRYRQKKKIELSIILESESELQQEHDDLEKKKDNLHREILMVKQLLRDVIQAKKPATANKVVPIVHGSGSSTVSLNIRNRRK